MHRRGRNQPNLRPCKRSRTTTSSGIQLGGHITVIRFVTFAALVLLLCNCYHNRRKVEDLSIHRSVSADLGGAKLEQQAASTFLNEIAKAEPKERDPVLVNVETKFNGLGAQSLRLVDAMALTEYIGGKLEVRRLNYWNYACVPRRDWDCYFKYVPRGLASQSQISSPYNQMTSKSECIELAHLNVSLLRRGACATISSSRSQVFAAAVLRRLPYPESLHATRSLAQRFWHYNRRTQQRVDKLCERAGIGQRGVSQYVAIHIRRGDKLKEVPIISVSKYIQAMEVVAPPGMPVFVATDDGTTIRQFRKLTNRRVLSLVGAASRSGHVQKVLNDQPTRAKEHTTDELLAEIHALVGAEWFIGTFSSNLGRLVHVLRTHPPQTSISLDDRWAPSVAFHTFGKSYCGWEGANKEYCESIKKGVT